MASALITALRVSNKSAPSVCACVAECYYWGDDVPADVEGEMQRLAVNLPTGYTLADLKAALIAAAQSRATELSLTLASSDVDLVSFESG